MNNRLILKRFSLTSATLLASTMTLHYSAKLTLAVEDILLEKYQTLKQAAVTSFATWQGLEPTKPPLPPTRQLSLREWIDQESVEQGVNPALVRALIKIESNWNTQAVSPKGAIGLTQVMPENARRCKLSSALLLLIPELNARCGIQILKENLLSVKGDTTSALKLFNGGPKALKQRIPESETHAQRVLAELGATLPPLL